MRIARVSAVGVAVEADRAQRARDLREKAELRDALPARRLHVERLDAAAQEGGPVERAWLAEGKAELARARGRGSAREWAKAAARLGADRASLPGRDRALARGRGARRRRAIARPRRRPRAALESASELGSRWLAAEVTALGRTRPARRSVRGRGRRDGTAAPHDAEDPFGLTPRERQVLALLAQGATNRQIGAALFMAEKTASVHVSRILAKLDVQGRTAGGGGRAPAHAPATLRARASVRLSGDAHAGRMGAPRADADGLAVPARAVGRDD